MENDLATALETLRTLLVAAAYLSAKETKSDKRSRGTGKKANLQKLIDLALWLVNWMSGHS